MITCSLLDATSIFYILYSPIVSYRLLLLLEPLRVKLTAFPFQENEQEDISEYDPMTGKKVTKADEVILTKVFACML